MPDDYQIGSLQVGKSHTYIVQCDMFAYRRGKDEAYNDNANLIMVASFAGTGTGCKAMMAALHSPKSWPEIRPLGLGNLNSHIITRPASCGYVTKKVAIGFGQFHMVAVAKDPRLMLELNQDALWKALRSPDITTPVIRPWMTWMLVHMLQKPMPDGDVNHIEKLTGFQTNCGYLHANLEQIDEVVSHGIVTNKLKFTRS